MTTIPSDLSPEAVTPEPITRMATGFMAAKHLFVASHLGLFEQLSREALPLPRLAQLCGTPTRTTRILADSMVALGFLTRTGDLYGNSSVAQAYLAGPPGEGLRPFLRFWDQISYPAWEELEGAARTGNAAGLRLDEAQQSVFSVGVEALTAGTARALAAGYDFERHRRLLDVGGGTGSFLVAALSAHDHLEGTLFELPAVAAVALRGSTGSAVADRIRIVEGDFLRDDLPRGHDLLLVANVIHLFEPEVNRTLLSRLRSAVATGGRMLLVDFWTDPGHTEPLFAALMAGEFLVVAGGDVYSAEEAGQWLAATGWRTVECRPLNGPAGLIVAEAE